MQVDDVVKDSGGKIETQNFGCLHLDSSKIVTIEVEFENTLRNRPTWDRAFRDNRLTRNH